MSTYSEKFATLLAPEKKDHLITVPHRFLLLVYVCCLTNVRDSFCQMSKRFAGVKTYLIIVYKLQHPSRCRIWVIRIFGSFLLFKIHINRGGARMVIFSLLGGANHTNLCKNLIKI